MNTDERKQFSSAFVLSVSICVHLWLTLFSAVALADPPEPRFRHQTIDDKIEIGYGVAAADVDGDKRIDILVADKTQFAWYRNPTWEKFVIAENLTKRDNVCLAAEDLDGDGKCELAVGGDWAPNDRENSGAVFYMIAPEDRTQRWEAVKLHAEPTVHRMRWIITPEGWGLVVVPLHGRGREGKAASKVLLYRRPNDPRQEWATELIDDSMHRTHNLHVSGHSEMLLAGQEGLLSFTKEGGAWKKKWVVKMEHGAGEVGFGDYPRRPYSPFYVTVEPMHGNELVMYKGVERRVITDHLVEGHALACTNTKIVVGWRGGGGGVAMYPVPYAGEIRDVQQVRIDDGGMACEDLCLADLDGDGDLEIIASGRATKNVKIYWNETPSAASTKSTNRP